MKKKQKLYRDSKLLKSDIFSCFCAHDQDKDKKENNKETGTWNTAKIYIYIIFTYCCT